MKRIANLVFGLIIFSIIFSGCSVDMINPFEGARSSEVPVLPDSVSGGNIEASASLRALYDPIPPDPSPTSALNSYGAFFLVPQLAFNYNFWIRDRIDPLLDAVKNDIESLNGAEWVEISKEPYKYELTETVFGFNSVLRVNDDFTQYEIYWPSGIGETRYLKVIETESYVRATLIIQNPGGDETSIDTAEVIETSDKIYSKVVRLYKIQTEPEIHHFVAITDKTTADKKTTGRYMNINGQADFTFPREPGGESGTGYWDPETYPDIPAAQNVYEIFGFFNDIDLYKSVSTVDWNADGYPDPAELTPLFAEGLTTEFVSTIEIDDTAASPPPIIPEWNEALIE